MLTPLALTLLAPGRNLGRRMTPVALHLMQQDLRPTLGAAGFASSSSKSPAAKRHDKKKALKIRYFKPANAHGKQKDGDFPVQLRPTKLDPPEVRDLSDMAVDPAVGHEAVEDVLSRPRKIIKPHKVKAAIQHEESQIQQEQLKTFFPRTVSGQELKERKNTLGHRLEEPPIPKFDVEKDMSREDAIEVSAMRARALARRNYKWVPNPYGPKPADLAPTPEAQARYFDRYFDGSTGKDGGRQLPSGAGVDEEFRESRPTRPKRERLSPKQFWIQPNYVSPEPPTVSMMTSRELKFAMVNEAYEVCRWRSQHPEGSTAGLPPGTAPLWLAFGLRAAELSHCRIPVYSSLGLDFVSPGNHIGGVGAAATEGQLQSSESLDLAAEAARDEAKGRRPTTRCSLSTTLRFLQALARVQAGPYSALYGLTSRVVSDLRDLKPQQCFFLLQAMSRLRIQHPKSQLILQRMSLAWRTLPHKNLVKTANAVAKLDLGGHLWAKPLKLALVRALPQLSGTHFSMLKAITVMELFNDEEALKAYLHQAEELKGSINYLRVLRVVELYVHLLQPEVWASLDDQIRLFLEKVRSSEEATEASKPKAAPGGARRRGRRGGNRSEERDEEDDFDDDDDEDEEEEGDGLRPHFDRVNFTSALHEDVSRILNLPDLGVEHANKVPAGPLLVDMCHLPTLTVIETAPAWQYYLQSPQLTSLARRRQELLQAMGFKVIRVPYHRWKALTSDEEKVDYMRSQLPVDVLPLRPLA